ncbi:hypothetical protein [Acidianus ambivalens]|jgi:hypothetical protein|uniref:Uncharacterized protein n=1 Tax=Acidianus ambivalens TaxID=2283 RepID=A0A650CUF2_ACIAM|nr:hypothetical protein [Acidianus ambivalens]MQL56121.1 hypothetical protein [Acidianus ambivalens]QGR21335.1 hypothetical protein D1866_04505 [Acidianus ambivalens]
MKVIESLYDRSMSEHGLFAKDVLDEIIPKLKANAHYFRSKGSIFSLAPSNKYIWTMRINLKPFYVILCKYRYTYWTLPDLELKMIDCYRLKGEVENYFKEKFYLVIEE